MNSCVQICQQLKDKVGLVSLAFLLDDRDLRAEVAWRNEVFATLGHAPANEPRLNFEHPEVSRTLQAVLEAHLKDVLQKHEPRIAAAREALTKLGAST